MTCPKCGQTIENGAAFCGNCGQALLQAAPQAAPAAAPAAAAPAAPPAAPVLAQPAAAAMAPQAGNVAMAPVPASAQPGGKAVWALVLSILGFSGVFIPILGVILSVLGFIFGLQARRSPRHGMAIASIVISILAFLLSLLVWVLAAIYISTHQAAGAASLSTAASGVSAVSNLFIRPY